MGFCFGVRRAVENAENALEKYSNKKVFSLGPLIHNKTVLENLKNKGLNIANEDDLFSKNSIIKDGSVVIIRAHGVPPVVLNELNKKNCVIIDATCPRVKASQKLVEQKSLKNFSVVFTGDSNHGEVSAVFGYAFKKFTLIQNELDSKNFINENLENREKILLLSQTTFSQELFSKISEEFCKNFCNIEVVNTICPATKERQDALLDLCKKVDCVLVIGGKNSANTIRLFLAAKNQGKPVFHIENAAEIPCEVFEFETVGITAGASTPDEVINEIEEKLKNKS